MKLYFAYVMANYSKYIRLQEERLLVFLMCTAHVAYFWVCPELYVIALCNARLSGLRDHEFSYRPDSRL